MLGRQPGTEKVCSKQKAVVITLRPVIRAVEELSRENLLPGRREMSWRWVWPGKGSPRAFLVPLNEAMVSALRCL